MTSLVDADIVAYRCAASAENEGEEVALLRTDAMMMDCITVDADYIAFLTGKNNFRYEINPEYKANRKDKPKPQYLELCRNYLIDEYKAIVTDGYEADDALGFHQTNESVIFTIDKDLLMIPGCHYNFVTKEYKEVTEIEGLQTFYRQMLIGDVGDNIKGVAGIGKVKAAKLINHLETEEEMFDTVYDLYVASFADIDCMNRFWMNADCLWIWRKEGERFSDRYENK